MNNWIKCVDHLPEKGQQVLAFRPNTNHFYPGSTGPVQVCLVYRTLCTGVVCDNNRGLGYEWKEYGPMKYWGWEMTHWQPVPESPPFVTRGVL